MHRKRFMTKFVIRLVILVALLSAGAPSSLIAAQGDIVLTLSVPAILEDLLTPDVLARFEAENPGVSVFVDYAPNPTFGLGGSSSLEARLEETEAYVSTADVLYVDAASLYVESTQAGYFLDLAPLANTDPSLNISDFVPTLWASYQWDNGIWALPISTDAVLFVYDPIAFDDVGLAYPNEFWTIDDIANAARLLTEYDENGNVVVPGLTTNFGGDNLGLLLQTLYGGPLFDSAVTPNTPHLTDPALETILDTWYELQRDGVVVNQLVAAFDSIPIKISGLLGYAFNFDDDSAEVSVTLLPGGTSGLLPQAVAVSSGTAYPEQAYALARFLTTVPEIASTPLSVATARYSLADLTTSGPGGGFLGNLDPEIQAVVDQGVEGGLSLADQRYAGFLSTALAEMMTTGTDVRTALQIAEDQAMDDRQTALDMRDDVTVVVAPPPAAPVLAPGETILTCAINPGFGGGGMGGVPQLPNEDEWNQLIANFVASDPQIGHVNLEPTDSSTLAILAGEYDCFILSSNEIPGSDLSSLLNLDPLIDTDPTFDRNDVLGNTLAQLQQDNQIWALPLAVQPQMLLYDSEIFAREGVPAPVNGWTTDQFVDALHTLKLYEEDPAPFVPNDISGSYMMMLIGAYGGLPIDYRTTPTTLSFTDPANVDAIRQVLDLAVDGYIDYSSLTEFGFESFFADDDYVPITSDFLSQFASLGLGIGETASTQRMTTYPQGTQFGTVAYGITTGYISRTAQNPEAAYRFLSAAANTPQLFSGMPARRSLVNRPEVIAAQGEEIVAIYQQMDALMRDPNTIIFPVFSPNAGAILNLVQEYWLRQVFDDYIFNDADLESGLAEAEVSTIAYQECAAAIPPIEGDSQEQRREFFQEIIACITLVDPTFQFGF